jgi:hypothetical protein
LRPDILERQIEASNQVNHKREGFAGGGWMPGAYTCRFVTEDSAACVCGSDPWLYRGVQVFRPLVLGKESAECERKWS